MKIAISSAGETIEDDIDVRFGRCPYFLIVELEGKEVKSAKAVENTAKAQMGGAGITAGEIVGNEGVDAVITTNLGPRAFSVFSQLGIRVYLAEGRIKKALEDFAEGKLKELNDANGPQHRGLR
jgi:predicted Fe-Mo cluster-binding NifX family protein